MTFNPLKPHGQVHGAGVAGACYYQDGSYFDVAGRYLFSDPDRAAPMGCVRKMLEQAQAEHEGRESTAPPAPPVPAAKETQDTSPSLPEGATREQKLNQFNAAQLMRMMQFALKVTNDALPEAERKDEKTLKDLVIKGQGAKPKLVKWLLENTSE